MVHRALKLQHHQHTAKRLSHEHTSYRGLFVVLLVSLLCLTAIGQVRADDYSVSATVPAGSLTVPADITSPADGSVLQTSTAEIKGTCQIVVLGTIVVIERNGTDIGSQACQSNGTFSITVTLLEGQNILVPKEFDGGGAQGPDGSAVNVTYQPAAVVPPPISAGGATVPARSTAIRSAANSSKPLNIRLDRAYLVYQLGQSVGLPISIAGGMGPYVLHIDWGDGVSGEWNIASAGARNFEHTYAVANAYKIKLTLQDSTGQHYEAQVGTINFTAPTVGFISPIHPMDIFKTWFATPVARLVWGGYLLICALTVAMWWASPTHTLFWNELAPGRAFFKRRP
jgi:hypothetical protein